ncbi:MAG: tetratricopeptide repeat protein [Deltaproteobacteria bacterium]|nr:tetratricopeptide repeat protein [Deltaproteobacteria bacterium]
MNRNNIVIIVVIVVAVAIAAYLIGSKSGDSTATGVKQGMPQNGGAYYPMPQTNPNEVIAELEKQIAANPKDAKLHVSIGKAYFGLQKFDMAAAHYKNAVKLDPKDVDSYNDLGLSLHYMKNSSEAISFIDKGIAVNPYYQRIWLTKGFVLATGLNDVNGANEAWKKAISIDPNSEVAAAAKSYIAKVGQTKAGK